MNDPAWVARNLAVALLAGAWTPRALLRRAQAVLVESDRESQRALVRELLGKRSAAYPPAPARLVAMLLASPHFERASALLRENGPRLQPVLKFAAFNPAPPFAHLDIPRIATVGDLAAWLDITVEHLAWFADARRQHGRAAEPNLQHYAYAFALKRSGLPRLLESPKPRLKALQRRILRGILDRVPVHDRAHGFVAGRSCLSAAQVHAGEAVVVTLDLRDFFLRTPLRRVHGLFRSLGYPWAVARLLTGLCTTSTPESVFLQLPAQQRPDQRTRQIHQAPHLPQGAPTSPALANLVAWGLDVRLHGLARSLDAAYTRYADDLAFSGGADFARRLRAFLAAVEEIAADEGYALNHGKTRIMRRGGRQRVTGLLVNDHLNVAREHYDALKAILHNCRRNGPQAENRAGHSDFRRHLEGRVAWVETVNRRRGERLRRMFEEIRW
jgi:hypothetical protein